ncbi:MAG: hypothetical protein KDK24_16245 [Pseudooceanicola sp.]|nr:hypothetical protein [Pseudooceanicola sp.]
MFVYLTGPSFAQDEGGGLRLQFGLQQTFGTADNLSLGVPGSVTNPEEGRTTLSTTDVVLNLSSETRTQRFQFQIGGAMRYGDTPVGSRITTGFVDPVASLYYSHEGANSRLVFEAAYSESAISSARPLWDFRDDENVITPPADLAQLQGTGERQESRASVDFETGLTSPLGFRFRADRSSLKYVNATTATPTDRDATNLLLSTLFRFSPLTTLVLDLRAGRTKNRILNSVEDSRSVQVGLDRMLANGGQVSARVGYSDADTNNAAAPSGSRGVTGSLNYSAPLPNGTYGASYQLSRTGNGEIDTLRLRRAYVLPTGSLDFSVGASSVQGNSPQLIGGIRWVQQLPSSTISVNLDRAVTTDANDNDVFTTSLAAQYRFQVNTQSSLFANLSYFQTDDTAITNQVSRTNLSLGYNRDLTERWSLQAGVNLTIRDEALGGSPASRTLGRGESRGLFVSLSRTFDLN